eukprot:5371415-Amphidinium_carterae.2
MEWLKHLTGEGGEQKIQALIDMVLPSETSFEALESTLGCLDEMKESDIYQFAGECAKAQVTQVRSLIQRMLDGISPEKPANASPWLERVFLKLPYYARYPEFPDQDEEYQQPSEKGAEVRPILHGADAVRELWAQMKDQPEDKLSLQEVNRLVAFFLCLPDTLQIIKDEILQKIKSVMSKAVAKTLPKTAMSAAKPSGTTASKKCASGAEAAKRLPPTPTRLTTPPSSAIDHVEPYNSLRPLRGVWDPCRHSMLRKSASEIHCTPQQIAVALKGIAARRDQTSDNSSKLAFRNGN